MPKVKKASKSVIKLVKGMKDILPNEQVYWELIRNKVSAAARDYGFQYIDTPVVEATALFKRAVGEETDAVSKEMYSFVDQGGEKLSLRPENTAGVVRAYIEHGMLNLPQPVKLFYFAPQFRHDKPQAGRYRQFWQFGFEVLGENDPIVDAQMISLSYFILQELGLNVEVQVNSIGDDNCVKKCQDLAKDAPQTVDHLCDECNKHFTSVLEYLDELDVKYNLNSKIVRGLDYYTRTAWEIVETSEEGKLNALGGGGRYDDLVYLMGGRQTPAIGFACGVERIINKMKDVKAPLPENWRPDVYVATLGPEARKKALHLLLELRKENVSVSEDLAKTGLKGQLESADKKGARFALILGQKEIVDGTVLIRDMENGVQEVVDIKKAVKEVQKRLEHHLIAKVLKKSK
ncbi:MAG: Histidine-tRNA ligase [Parcubacteria group bacterium GW2011_GWA2_36_10]|nr:MAG: Histidine-tRNA ligase [Parcubacteria group bacterium GW2011_GWA2_36_10]